jgi:large subunit ribosomal protein L12e
VADDIAKGTQDWKGQKVTCRLTVQNRVCKVEVIPSAAALLVKALKEPSRDRKKEKNSMYSHREAVHPLVVELIFTVFI